MTDNPLVDLNNEERQIVRREVLIATIVRETIGKEKELRPKPGWQRFLESSGGTALITVVIGGLAGALISGVIQYGAKEREFQQSWLKARGDQAMVAYKDFVDKREDLVTRVFERIGTSTSASDDLIDLSKDEYAKADREGEQKIEVDKIRKTIEGNYTTSDKEWRNDQKRLESLISYYYPKKPDTPDVLEAWRSLEGSMSAYMKCAEVWLKEHPRMNDTSHACFDERGSLKTNVEQIGRAFGANRAYVWEGWESPDNLRKALLK